MPDKRKEKQQKTCVGKDLIASLSLPLSSSVSHTDKKKNRHLLGHISFAHVTA